MHLAGGKECSRQSWLSNVHWLPQENLCTWLPCLSSVVNTEHSWTK